MSRQLDAAQAPFALPMSAQLGKQKASLISLMNLNLNGSAIILTQKAWEKGLRPSLILTLGILKEVSANIFGVVARLILLWTRPFQWMPIYYVIG